MIKQIQLCVFKYKTEMEKIFENWSHLIFIKLAYILGWFVPVFNEPS